jgi:hypothetical protein
MKLPIALAPLFKRLSLLILGSGLGCCPFAFAQSDAGLIGKRYIRVDGAMEQARQEDIGNGYGFGGGVNLPLLENWDLGLSASYLHYSDFDFKDRRLDANLRGHLRADDFTPFADLLLGYSAQSSAVGGVKYTNHDGQVGLGLGAEVPISPATALQGRVAYWRWFDQQNGHYWTYTLGANHWFTPKLNVAAEVVWLDSETVTFRLSSSVRF